MRRNCLSPALGAERSLRTGKVASEIGTPREGEQGVLLSRGSCHPHCLDGWDVLCVQGLKPEYPTPRKMAQTRHKGPLHRLRGRHQQASWGMRTGAGPQLPLGTRELTWRGGPDQRAGVGGGWAAGPHSAQSSTPWAQGCPAPPPLDLIVDDAPCGRRWGGA